MNAAVTSRDKHCNILKMSLPLTVVADELCQQCKSFDLKLSDFFGFHSNEGRHAQVDDAFHMGKLLEVEARAAHCSLCRLVIAAIQDSTPVQFKDKRFYEVRLMWPYETIYHDPNFPKLRTLKWSCLVFNMPKEHRLESDQDDTAFRLGSLAVEGITPSGDVDFPCSARRLASVFDFSLLRKWIDGCVESHGKLCEPSQEIRGFDAEDNEWFWLIDVHLRCIIRPLAQARWIALSYVWGGVDAVQTTTRTLELFQKHGALDSCDPPLPQTIIDAMEVVQQLGMDYLWVDRLCIVQDDQNTKRQAMAAMHKVYHLATCTIVAAEGLSIGHGLLGVRPDSRGWQQVVEEIRPGLRLAALKNPVLKFDLHAAYNKRGWT